MWVLLYVIQFILWPFILKSYWYECRIIHIRTHLISYRISSFLGNTLYLAAFGYYFIISFLGYNGRYDNPYAFYSKTNNLPSPPFHKPYQVSSLPAVCLRHPLVRKSVRLQHPTAHQAGVPDRDRLSMKSSKSLLQNIARRIHMGSGFSEALGNGHWLFCY